jgi:oligopeptide/dipeptide ABC transporter ATP-binding protein
VTAPLLEVEHLRTSFRTPHGAARAVDDVSFTVRAGETVGLVGESGCGKSVTALSILGLVRPPGVIDPASRIAFESRELLALAEPDMRQVRGARIAMVFQEPMTSLNPVLRVGDQVAEVARIHDGASARDAWSRAVAMLEQVGLPDPSASARRYPHELSGGMRQRVMLAAALLMRPALLIADEATTALDVTVQAQILELIAKLQREMGMAVLLITHDLGVIAQHAQRVLVMYAGQIVEEAPVRALFAAPKHPYTQGLLAAAPRLGVRRERLAVIPGAVPSAAAWPTGCRFRERCALAIAQCATEPPLVRIGESHTARCHLAHA